MFWIKDAGRTYSSAIIAGVLACSVLFSVKSVNAEPLNGEAVKALALKGTWVSDDADWGNWSWKADNSVCLILPRLGNDCADTGTWKIDGDVMCYELKWWGESYDVRTNCFTVESLDGDRYESRYHGSGLDSTFIKFVVAE